MTTETGGTPEDLHERIEHIRQVLLYGGTVGHEGKQIRPDGGLLLIMAEMVHAHDVAMWEHNGKQGLKPSLGELLRRTQVRGKSLSLREWAAIGAAAKDQDMLPDELLAQLIEEDAEAAQVTLMPTNLPALVHIAPRDLPRLRREITAWLRGPEGIGFYRENIRTGRQNIFVPKAGPKDVALAQAEADALAAATLFFVDEDMCQLLLSAHESMPDWAAVKSDLPAETGFAIFASPISHHFSAPSATEEAMMIQRPDGSLVSMGELMQGEGTQVIGVSWRPYTDPGRSPYWQAGGVWFTFYAAPMSHELLRRGGLSSNARALIEVMASSVADVVPENECLMAWYDPATMEEDHYVKQMATRKGTAAWMRVVMCAFALARSAGLSQTDTEKVPARKLPKAKARATGVKELPGGQVQVVRLRAKLRAARDSEAPAGQDDTAKRVYRHQWVVRGFWRNTWYGKEGLHRPQWIAPYTKGPEGAPLLVKEKVFVVNAPGN